MIWFGLLVMCSRQLIGSHSALRLAELEQTTVGLHQVILLFVAPHHSWVRKVQLKTGLVRLEKTRGNCLVVRNY